MIALDFFTYTDQQRDDIKSAVRKLGHDAEQILIGQQYSVGGIETLWSRIETVATAYRLHGAVNARSPRRDELDTLRKDAEKLRIRIINSIAVPIGTNGDPLVHPFPLNGADADMLPATSRYFAKLLRTLDRQIKLAGSRRDNARKIDRDQCWSELLAIWIDIGGKPSGTVTAAFLKAASKPVMGSAVPTIASIMRWLERHQNETAEPVLR